jgi:hypothetical protein
MYLSAHRRGAYGGRLSGITPQQYTQLSQQLFNLQNQLAAENQAWATLVATSYNPPASDQHNANVAQLNAQIAAVMQQLQQPVDYPAPAPAPSPMAAPAPAPGQTPLGPVAPSGPGPTSAPSVAPGPIVPMPGALQPTGPGSPIETEVSTGMPGQLLTTGQGGSSSSATSSSGGGIWLAILAAGAVIFGGSGCATSTLDNRVYCSADRTEAAFTSWWLGFGVGSQINKRDAAALCGAAAHEAAQVK